MLLKLLDTMESNLPSSPSDNGGAKSAFRKPSIEQVNRKYRRRSQSNGSSSSDGTPNCARSSSPIPSREDPAKSSDDRWKKDDRRSDLDREYGRSQYGRMGDSYGHSDRHYYRNSHNYRRNDDYKSEKLVDEDERKYSKLSTHSGRDLRGGTHSDHTSREREQHGSRDHLHNADKYSQGKTDGSGHRSRYRDDSAFRSASSGHRLKETPRSDNKELDCQKYPKEEQKKYRDQESDRHKERYARELPGKSEDITTFTSEDQESPAKKQKLSSLDRGKDHGKNVSKFTTPPDERHSSNSQQAQKFVNKVTSDQDLVTDSDIDAAKVAAMKAAELVNRNLIGTGYMSADQKKKLLWGKKKNTAAVEESTHRWDTTLFSDRERQEKFNKLMSLRLPWYIWPIVGCEGRGTSRAQTRQSRWEQRRPSGEAESTTVGFGEAIYCWTASKRWAYSWTRSLRVYLEIFCICVMNFSYILVYPCARHTFLLTHNGIYYCSIEKMLKIVLLGVLGIEMTKFINTLVSGVCFSLTSHF